MYQKKKEGLASLLLAILIFSCGGPSKNQEVPDSEERVQAFENFKAKLPEAKLPYERSPHIDDKLDRSELDSSAVQQFIDPQLFDSECACQYLRGEVLLETEHYSALLFPLEWNAGTTYELFTYTPGGQVINKFEFAKAAETSLFGQITEDGLIRQVQIESFLEEVEGVLPSADTRQLRYFQITSEGKIEPARFSESPAAPWLGKWHLQTPHESTAGELSLLPDRPGHLYFQLLYVSQFGNKTRDASGLALIENQGRTAASLQYGCITMERAVDEIRLQGACLDALDANFSGQYLRGNRFAYRYLQRDEGQSDDFCDVFQVYDEQHRAFTFPAEVRAALDCSSLLGLSPDWQTLIFDNEVGVATYDFESSTVTQLIPLTRELEGLSSLAWSPDGRKAAFVEIQQEALPHRTRIHILSFPPKQIEHDQFDVPVHFACGGACFSIPYEDFWIGEDDKLYYLDDIAVKTGEEGQHIAPQVLELK